MKPTVLMRPRGELYENNLHGVPGGQAWDGVGMRLRVWALDR